MLMSNEPTRSLDHHVLEELYRGTGQSRSFMIEVAKLFRDEAEAFVLGVDALSPNEQAAALHSLAGAARTVGMKEVARLALKGEQAVKDQESPADDIASVKAALPDLSGRLDGWTAALPEE